MGGRSTFSSSVARQGEGEIVSLSYWFVPFISAPRYKLFYAIALPLCGHKNQTPKAFRPCASSRSRRFHPASRISRPACTSSSHSPNMASKCRANTAAHSPTTRVICCPTLWLLRHQAKRRVRYHIPAADAREKCW